MLRWVQMARARSSNARGAGGGGDFGGEFVVAAAQVLDEGVPGGEDPRGAVPFQAAHRPQPGLQPAMISLDRIVGIPLVCSAEGTSSSRTRG